MPPQFLMHPLHHRIAYVIGFRKPRDIIQYHSCSHYLLCPHSDCDHTLIDCKSDCLIPRVTVLFQPVYLYTSNTLQTSMCYVIIWSLLLDLAHERMMLTKDEDSIKLVLI